MSGITQDIYENTEIAVVAPATAPQNSTVTVTLAPIGSSVPISESSPVGTATINYADGFTTVLPAPSGSPTCPDRSR